MFYCVLKWSNTLKAVLMQLWPRSGVDSQPEANGDKKVARASEIILIVAVMKSRRY